MSFKPSLFFLLTLETLTNTLFFTHTRKLSHTHIHTHSFSLSHTHTNTLPLSHTRFLAYLDTYIHLPKHVVKDWPHVSSRSDFLILKIFNSVFSRSNFRSLFTNTKSVFISSVRKNTLTMLVQQKNIKLFNLLYFFFHPCISTLFMLYATFKKFAYS